METTAGTGAGVVGQSGTMRSEMPVLTARFSSQQPKMLLYRLLMASVVPNRGQAEDLESLQMKMNLPKEVIRERQLVTSSEADR